MPTERILNALTDDTTLSDRMKKVLSIVFLLIAFAISMGEYFSTHFVFIKRDENIRPDMIGAVVAITMLMPLYARGILVWRKTIYKLIVFVLLLAVFASIASIALDGKGVFTKHLVIASVTLSWLGMRSVAGFGWILVFAAALLNLITVSEAMGIWGFLFISSSFLGLVFHADLAPEKMINEMLDEYTSKTAKVASGVSDDINAAAATVKERLG